MKLKFNGFLVLLLVLVAQVTFAQDRVVSGVVSDNTSMPLPGVSVLVKGTKSGTQTDFDGKFSIKATSSQVLIFSFIGMKTQEVSASSSSINVKMASDAFELEGVVVTAFGIKKSEKAIGYAAQSVKGSSLTEARETNLVNALSGKIAGVQVTNSSGAVGASSRIVLRGNSTITGNNQALFVVDGIPFDNTSYGNADDGGGRDLPNGVASINPDDVESITVLKGPNAAALYGLRASNGVIIITTKSGKKGKGLSVVSFNTNTTFTNPLLLPKYQNSYGQGSTSDYFEFVDGAGGGYNDGVDESWGPALDKGLSFVQWDSYKVGGAPLPWISHKDNVKDFYETGLSQSNNISLSAGSDEANFRMSIGNSDERGMLHNTDFKKFNVSLNGNVKLGEKLTGGVTLNYFNDKSNNLPTGGYDNENAAQQFIWSARNVKYTDLKNWRNLPLAPEGTPAEGTPLNWNTNFQNNPYWILDTNTNTYDRDRLTGAAFMGYQVSNSISATGKVSLDHYSQLTTNRQAIGSNSAADGTYAENALRFSEINTEAIIGYKKQLTDEINFSINFGGNKMKRVRTQNNGSITGLELPNFYNLSNIKSGTTAVSGNDYNEIRIGSVFGFGEISYKDYVYINFSGRNDWASVLPTANNSFFYPAISGSLVLSEILDMKEYTVNYLKLRGGWSKVGGTGALGAYNLNQTFDLSTNGFGNQASSPATQFNPNLKPESVIGIEVGVDFNAFNNRLRFSGTYYTKESSDLLVPIQVSSATGFTSVWDNIAEMENKGFELQLGVTAIKSKDFTFDIDLNFAKNDNKVVSLGALDTYILGGQWGINLEARAGQPYGSLVGRGFEKDASGNVIYENGIPKIESATKILGNITPDWTGGANFTFKYKDFDLSTLIDAKIGGDVHSMTYAWGRYAGTLEESLIGRETGVVGNGVMSDGAGGYIPNNVVVSAKSFNQSAYGNTIEESAIFDASYVKLRQLSLGYSIPKKLLQNTPIQDFKFSIVARNLAILYKKAPHIDPETGFSSTNGNQGQEFGQIPSARSIGFNINVQF
ncbi:SusC/RagA family TonB-linked outer membrane protein [Flavobacterium franklandianum]|uniref:SusC/RagA family TonB-linked outer membrane protein n=1 Tax=Flavobacterium franklandianum TaxID=2594430 RepID=UPI00117BAC20|nr:SusC/RagA family TonB-linked outer membrane protein [Flavobacterium franklandianum]TRX24936.1 SusC/RagA family TonB-linked outer membrane protein [Flavobacterium franklandianum]